jgi:hypothetical protein
MGLTKFVNHLIDPLQPMKHVASLIIISELIRDCLFHLKGFHNLLAVFLKIGVPVVIHDGKEEFVLFGPHLLFNHNICLKNNKNAECVLLGVAESKVF